MKYAIIKSIEIEGLEARVQEMVNIGWLPQGGIGVAWRPRGDASYMLHTQAMIKPAPSFWQRLTGKSDKP